MDIDSPPTGLSLPQEPLSSAREAKRAKRARRRERQRIARLQFNYSQQEDVEMATEGKEIEKTPNADEKCT